MIFVISQSQTQIALFQAQAQAMVQAAAQAQAVVAAAKTRGDGLVRTVINDFPRIPIVIAQYFYNNVYLL